MTKITKAKSSKTNNDLNVHPIIEAGVIAVKILVLFTALIVFVISLMANAEWYDILIRTSLAMIIIGLLGWYANWILGKWVLKYELEQFEKERREKNKYF
jgi:hypothetical protein